jgi:amino acid transporter
MEKVIIFVAFAMLLAVLILLFIKVAMHSKSDWKLASCLAGFTIAASILLLMAGGKIALLKYGDASLLIDQKTEEVKKLTDRNKRLAKLTADAISAAMSGTMVTEGFDSARLDKALNELREEAGSLGATNVAITRP